MAVARSAGAYKLCVAAARQRDHVRGLAAGFERRTERVALHVRLNSLRRPRMCFARTQQAWQPARCRAAVLQHAGQLLRACTTNLMGLGPASGTPSLSTSRTSGLSSGKSAAPGGSQQSGR